MTDRQTHLPPSLTSTHPAKFLLQNQPTFWKKESIALAKTMQLFHTSKRLEYEPYNDTITSGAYFLL